MMDQREIENAILTQLRQLRHHQLKRESALAQSLFYARLWNILSAILILVLLLRSCADKPRLASSYSLSISPPIDTAPHTSGEDAETLAHPLLASSLNFAVSDAGSVQPISFIRGDASAGRSSHASPPNFADKPLADRLDQLGFGIFPSSHREGDNLALPAFVSVAHAAEINELHGFLSAHIRKVNPEADAQVITQAILDARDELKIDPETAALLLLAMIEKESTFRADAVGDRGRAIGLMQWHWRPWGRVYAPGLSRREYFDPFVNVDVGAAILARYRPEGNLWLAVARYNNPRSKSPNAYAKAVRKIYEGILD